MPGGPYVNGTAANEHAPDIEWRIRVVKEQNCCQRHSLFFNQIPKMMTIRCVLNVCKLLNLFPSKGGIPDVYSSRTILTDQQLDYDKHFCIQLGEYCQVHEEEKPCNREYARTHGAICLGPCGNLQGGFYFMRLASGKNITRYIWDDIPMTDTVIRRVNQLVRGQPKRFLFTDQKGRPIGNVELTGVDGEESQEKLDEDDDLELPNTVDE